MIEKNFNKKVELDNIIILTRRGQIRAIGNPRNIKDTEPEYIDDLPEDIHAAVIAVQAYFGNKMGFGDIVALKDELVVLAADSKPEPIVEELRDE